MKLKVKTYIFLLLIILTSGCKKVLVDKDNKALQPYKQGDILVFQNTNGLIDTITINKIESYINPTDPLDVFPTKIETMFVSGTIKGRRNKENIIENEIAEIHINLLKLEASEKSDYFMFTYYNPNNNLKCPTTLLYVNEIKEKLKNNSNRTTIKAEEYYDNLADIDYDLVSFEWDLKLGYTKFIYKDSLHLDLIDFIRDEKSLIN